MKYLLLLTTLFLVCSCSTSETKDGNRDLKKLKDEVMAIHDEVMPRMGDLRKTRKALILLADSIGAEDSIRAKDLLIAADELAAANQSMMVWMRQYEPQLEASKDSLWNYYSGQKEGIQKVRNELSRELREGQALLNQ